MHIKLFFWFKDYKLRILIYIIIQFSGKHRLEKPVVATSEEANTKTKDTGGKKKGLFGSMFSFISGVDDEPQTPTHPVYKKKKIVNQSQYDWWSR